LDAEKLNWCKRKAGRQRELERNKGRKRREEYTTVKKEWEKEGKRKKGGLSVLPGRERKTIST